MVTFAVLRWRTRFYAWRGRCEANGYRNWENFRIAIYFHLGGLDLYPEALCFNPHESLMPFFLRPLDKFSNPLRSIVDEFARSFGLLPDPR